MATMINIITFEIKPSVNTPDYTRAGGKYYDNGNWRKLNELLPVPTCDNKYWKWSGSSVVEMNM